MTKIERLRKFVLDTCRGMQDHYDPRVTLGDLRAMFAALDERDAAIEDARERCARECEAYAKSFGRACEESCTADECADLIRSMANRPEDGYRVGELYMHRIQNVANATFEAGTEFVEACQALGVEENIAKAIGALRAERDEARAEADRAHRDAMEAIRLTHVLRNSLRRMVAHLEREAAAGDGVHEDAWDDYHAARMLVNAESSAR